MHSKEYSGSSDNRGITEECGSSDNCGIIEEHVNK